MRKRNWSVLVLNSVLIVIILFLVLPNILVIYPFLVGADYTINNTVGSSMVPAIRSGDTLFIKDGTESIRVGDIILFKKGPEEVTCHRVIETQINPNLMFKTKGDANKKPDGWIAVDQVKSKVVYIIPARFFVPSLGLIALMTFSASFVVILMIIKKSSSPNLTTMLLVVIFMYSLGRLL